MFGPNLLVLVCNAQTNIKQDLILEIEKYTTVYISVFDYVKFLEVVFLDQRPFFKRACLVPETVNNLGSLL